jgi:hypothetical protein
VIYQASGHLVTKLAQYLKILVQGCHHFLFRVSVVRIIPFYWLEPHEFQHEVARIPEYAPYMFERVAIVLRDCSGVSWDLDVGRWHGRCGLSLFDVS